MKSCVYKIEWQSLPRGRRDRQGHGSRFIEEGATVVICDVNQQAGEAAVAELGPKAAFYR